MSDRKPNFLFLISDEHVYHCLGCAGNEIVETPQLDALAADGLRFDAAYSNAPVCTPYRAALLSGRYGSQTDTLRNCAPLPTDTATLAETLKAAGYRCGWVGKWHLGGNGQGPIASELRGGFEDFIGYQCYNDYLHNVAFYDEDGNERRFNKHRTEATADLAIERLQAMAEDERPFALFVSWQNPHYPMEPSPGWAARYANTTIPLRANQAGDLDPFTPTFSPRSPQPFERDPNNQRYGGNLQRYLQLYYAMVSQLDEQIGRVLAWLRILGHDDQTIVTYTSDHGECQGAHGAREGKHMANKGLWWEESARVPQIMRVPEGLRGATTAPVGCIDFYPTCCDYAGCLVPEHCEGQSLKPLLDGQEQERQPVICEMHGWASIRLGDWKLVMMKEDRQALHLFDCTNDPLEMSDRRDDPTCAGIRDDLLARLRSWADRVAAGSPA